MLMYLAETLAIQPPRKVGTRTGFPWLSRLFEEHRRRAAAAREMAGLRGLDRDVLDDIGASSGRLQSALPHLASLNPHLVAVNFFTRRSN